MPAGAKAECCFARRGIASGSRGSDCRCSSKAEAAAFWLTVGSPEWPYDREGTYECAFCGQVIDHAGWDPCEITVQAARDVGDAPGHWVFWGARDVRSGLVLGGSSPEGPVRVRATWCVASRSRRSEGQGASRRTDSAQELRPRSSRRWRTATRASAPNAAKTVRGQAPPATDCWPAEPCAPRGPALLTARWCVASPRGRLRPVSTR